MQIHCSINGRFMCAATHDGCIQCFDFDSSQLKSMKVTKCLMKSASINSTHNATKQPKAVVYPSRANDSQRIIQKQNVSKVTRDSFEF